MNPLKNSIDVSFKEIFLKNDDFVNKIFINIY